MDMVTVRMVDFFFRWLLPVTSQPSHLVGWATVSRANPGFDYPDLQGGCGT